MAIVNSDNFLKHVAKIELEYQASIVQVKSQSGRRRAQRRGPLLYNMEMTVEPAKINSPKYYDIMQFIQNLNYGNNTAILPIDSSTSILTAERGLWSGTPVVSGADQIGQSITITDGTTTAVTGYASPFDYVQFQGSTKVYQVSAITSSINGITTISSDGYDTEDDDYFYFHYYSESQYSSRYRSQCFFCGSIRRECKVPHGYDEETEDYISSWKYRRVW